MKILKKVYYHQLEKVKDILKVKEIYRMPWIIHEEELEKEINMDEFIFPWKRNWDFYFSSNNWNKNLEKIENVYFSKNDLDKWKYEFIDYFPDVDLLMYVKFWEKNNILN
jgi:hypothetical protein